MRKFKFMSKAVVGMMSAAMAMGSLSGVAVRQPIGVYAAASDITLTHNSKDVKNKIITAEQGENITLVSTVTADSSDDTSVDWSVDYSKAEGATAADVTVVAGTVTIKSDAHIGDYTITATSKTNSAEEKKLTASVTLTVKKETAFGYGEDNCNELEFTVNVPSDEANDEEDDIKPVAKDGYTYVENSKYSISPALPQGLKFDETTGQISGTPIGKKSIGTTTHTIKSTYKKGEAAAKEYSVDVTITVNPTPTAKISLKPSSSTIKYTDHAVTVSVAEDLNKGEVVVYTVTDDQTGNDKGTVTSNTSNNILTLTIDEEVKVGTKITVTAVIQDSDPEVKAETTITVAEPTTRKVESITLSGTDIGAAHNTVRGNARLILGDGDLLPPTEKENADGETEQLIKWEVKGSKLSKEDKDLENDDEKTHVEGSTRISYNSVQNLSFTLYISEFETSDKLTVSLTYGDVTGSMDILVADAARLDIDYEYTMPFKITSTNGEDSFLFLDVVKSESLDAKASATYCYEALGEDSSVSIDPSSLKLTKGGYVRVYGDVNTEPLKVYKIAAQVVKPTIKYVAGKDTLLESFQYGKGKSALTAVDAANLQWKLPASNVWYSFVDEYYDEYNLHGLENYLPTLQIAGSTILVREVAADGSAMPSTEVKVKIPAAPKAPKATVDYAKNTVKLVKDAVIRVPGWVIPTEGKDKYGDTCVIDNPYYYTVGTDKAKLNPDPATLAEDMLKAYVKARNEAAAKLTDDKKKAEYTISEKVTYAKDAAGKDTEYIEEENEFANMLENMSKNGYKFLLYTKNKKGTSQPTFVNIKAAPTIEVEMKNVGTAEKPEWKQQDKITAYTEKKDEKTGKMVKEYTSNSVSYKWSEDGVTLTPANSGSFAYSVDDGKKFSVLKKATLIKTDKAKSGVIVRTVGVKENLKNNIIGKWASNDVSVPVAVKEVKVEGKAEITASTADVKEVYKVTVKDFFGNEVKDNIIWAASGTTEDGTVAFDEKTQTLTVQPAAKDGTVKITVTCGDVKDELEVKVKAAEKKPATVTSVTVTAKKKADNSALTSPATNVAAGEYIFEAVVAGTGDPAQTVTWSVEFKDKTNNSGDPASSFGTDANANANVLTVDTGDKGKVLVITATSTIDTTKTSTAFEITPN